MEDEEGEELAAYNGGGGFRRGAAVNDRSSSSSSFHRPKQSPYLLRRPNNSRPPEMTSRNSVAILKDSAPSANGCLWETGDVIGGGAKQVHVTWTSSSAATAASRCDVTKRAPTTAGAPPRPSAGEQGATAEDVLAFVEANRDGLMMCRHCNIIYSDQIVYYLHMGLHNLNNPWQCNLCGKVCSNAQQFSSHVIHY